MDKVKINLFGDSWSIKELNIEDRVRSNIDSISIKLNREIPELLLDLSFYEILGFPEIKSIEDLEGVCIKGLLNTPNGQLEFWLNGKKILKIKLNALYHQDTLFKLYETHETIVEFENFTEGVYLFENEKGLVSSYQFSCQKFNLSQLRFGLLKFIIDDIKHEILTDIFWEDTLLEAKNADVVLTSSHCRIR